MSIFRKPKPKKARQRGPWIFEYPEQPTKDEARKARNMRKARRKKDARK